MAGNEFLASFLSDAGVRAARRLPTTSPFGDSWLALDRTGGRFVVKRLPGLAAPGRPALDRLIRAGNASASPYVTVAPDGSDLVVVRPWVDGTAPRPAGAGGLATLGAGAAAALARLHSRGATHGGLSVTNLVVTDAGPVLTDAGLAALCGPPVPGPAAPPPEDDLGSLCALLLALAGPAPGPVRRLLTDRRHRPGTAEELERELRRLASSPDRARPGPVGRRPRAAGPAEPLVPSAPGATPGRRRRRMPRRVLVGGVVAAAGLGAGVTIAAAHLPGPHAAAPDRARSGAGTGRGSTGCREDVLPAAAGAEHGAWLDRGCAVPWAWTAGRLVTFRAGRLVTYRIGQPGDVFLTGRWTCGASELPGIYRPATGSVYLLGGWAAARRPVTGVASVPAGVPGGTPRVVGRRCQSVVLVASG